jgi:hypothetical protein
VQLTSSTTSAYVSETQQETNQLSDWIDKNLNDKLWEQEIPEEEQVIISSSIEAGIQEAEEAGCKPPHTFNAGSSPLKLYKPVLL